MASESPKLKRSLGLLECTLMGVGVMLGAGIYALVGQASALAGNAVWMAFLIASVVAGITGLSYAELSSFIPRAGGEYYYANRAFGPRIAFLATWLLVLGISVCSSTVAIGFAGYLHALTGVDEVLSASLVVAAAAGILIYGIKESAWVAAFCTFVEMVGLAIIITVGLPKLGTIDYFETAAGGQTGVLTAAALIFFAYVGFEEIVQLSEETREPSRNIPLAVLLSVVITTVLYVVVALCAVSVVGWSTLGTSKSPLADVAAVALGHKAFLTLGIIALFSTANTVLIMLMSAARLLYGMAEDGSLPSVFARIHRTRQTPFMATIAISALAVMMIVTLRKIAIVASLTNFALLTTFVIINGAVIVLRYREPDQHRSFRIPGQIGRLPVVPLLGVLTSLALLFYVDTIAIYLGTGITVIGLVLYRLTGQSRKR